MKLTINTTLKYSPYKRKIQNKCYTWLRYHVPKWKHAEINYSENYSDFGVILFDLEYVTASNNYDVIHGEYFTPNNSIRFKTDEEE